MYVINYITPDGCSRIIFPANEEDAAKGMGKAFAEIGMPHHQAVDVGSVVTIFLQAKGKLKIQGKIIESLEINGVKLSRVSAEELEAWMQQLFPKQ